jgi:hypothetical protein
MILNGTIPYFDDLTAHTAVHALSTSTSRPAQRTPSPIFVRSSHGEHCTVWYRYDLKVLQSYPFGTVPTWRVQFETKHLSREDRVATHQLLSQHGYLPLAQNHDDETWHHPKSNETFATGTEGASLQQAHASGTASPWRQLEQRQREHVESRRRAPI